MRPPLELPFFLFVLTPSNPACTTASTTGSASYLIPGSKFPFEGCKLRPNYNRWTLDMIEYVEDYVKGSRACFRFGLKPVDECMAAAEAEDVRCCVNDKKTNATTNLNKFKMFIGEPRRLNVLFLG